MTDYAQDSFVAIPMPGILEGADHRGPERNGVDETTSAPEARAVLSGVERALQGCSEYGTALWQELTAVATYLRENVARSSVLRTDEQWEQWEQIYGSVLSALAGPNGDSGYGASQATLERQHHRGV